MNRRRCVLAKGVTGLAAGLMLAACSGAAGPDAPEPEPPSRPVISPADFALLPCAEESGRPCALVLAGGKRLMFGAPAGAGSQADSEDLAGLEALFLFSVHPLDIEGVDEIRNRGWRAGRADALAVAGPDGTGALIDGLNAAYEQPDAISFIEDGPPAGGFDAALLSHGGDVTKDALVYDSGDLKVRAGAGVAGRITYNIRYRDLDEAWHEVVLRPCGGDQAGATPAEAGALDGLEIGCAGDESVMSDHVWPLDSVIFANKADH